MKRFYKTVSVQPRDGGSVVLLDGRVLKTPARAEMVLPTRALAEAVAAEWDAQQTKIAPLQMPLTRLAATAIDRVAADPAPTMQDILRYSSTDLLSYRVTEPAGLAARQVAVWQPLLDWFRQRFDIQLQVTTGIVAVPQAADMPVRLTRICDALDAMRLTALHAATTITGSVVLGLAMLERHQAAAEAHAAGLLDELYQAEQWGEDDEARQRRAALLAELQAVEIFLECLSRPEGTDLH
ncbi:ATP12 family protein [Ferrovibrio sp.]|uniref:ATP12 family chaperone protein n=1 Tax=Ferrovibrio sp. TaxID=1917215 RepID=UPI00311FFE43